MEDFESLRKMMLAKAKAGISTAYANEEYVLIQAINAYNESSKSYNLVYERLSEWFGLYFPELDISSSRTLARLIAVLIAKDYSYESILEVVKEEKLARSIYERAQGTIGRKPNSNESAVILKFAELAQNFAESIDALEKYIKIASEELMPNTTYLTEPRIAAELLSKAGSLERLATMPAGTIQLLGAENALFKHIKYGSRPPKYGLLFKLAEISSAPKELKGPMARIYATKISIALKADYYTKNFIAKELNDNIRRSIETLKRKPRKPKPAQRDNFKREQNNQNRNYNKKYKNKFENKGKNKNRDSKR